MCVYKIVFYIFNSIIYYLVLYCVVWRDVYVCVIKIFFLMNVEMNIIECKCILVIDLNDKS